MTDDNGIHSGSLQFYPRVRAKKVVPSANWKPLTNDKVGFMGFIGYKVGMVSVWAKDDTEHSMTQGKRIAIPATVLECPTMNIYSVRFYKNGRVLKDIVVSNDKSLKKSLKIGKTVGKIEEDIDFDDIRVILYSGINKTGIGKKKVDLIEIGISGNKDEKLDFVKTWVGKEISISDVFTDGMVDVRGVTKGYGSCGPVKRFGISLKSHKSEKGQRRPGSLAPWHPSRVTFRAPQMGQTGYHNRICYNNTILEVGKKGEKDINKKGGFKHYGEVKNDYIVIRGSIPGPAKRGILITSTLRATKYQDRKKFEVIEIR